MNTVKKQEYKKPEIVELNSQTTATGILAGNENPGSMMDLRS